MSSQTDSSTRVDRRAAAPYRRVSDLGKLRRMQRMSDADGFIRVAAIDHPENYLALFDADIASVSDHEVVESKLELIEAMASQATAVLVDPIWSFGQSVLSGVLPPGVGVLSGLELLSYSRAGFGTDTVLRPGWTVAELARLGADGAKLVVFHRTERAEVTASQHRLVADLVAQCGAAQVPLIVEPLWYPLDGETLDDAVVRRARVEAIIDSARTFAELGADVLKVEFPGYLSSAEDASRAEESCHRLAAAVGGKPWVLLSASATFETFRDQLAIAARAGACGFMAGRAIWGDGVGRFDHVRREAGARTATARLRELADVLRTHGRGWQSPVPIAETVSLFPRGWYEHR